jgi:hypothetical protein
MAISKDLLRRAKLEMIRNGNLKMHEDNREIPDSLSDLYAELNEELFAAGLPENLPVYWNSGLRRALGKCFYISAGKGRTRGIRVNCKPTKIEMNPDWEWTPRFLRKVMVHEMCHAWVNMKFGEVGHGQMFWKKMRECGYQKGHVFNNGKSNERDTYSLS